MVECTHFWSSDWQDGRRSVRICYLCGKVESSAVAA